MINRQQIIDKIQATLNSSTQFNSEDVVALALAIVTMEETANIITVTKRYDLPDLTVNTTITDGAVYYITELGIHAVKSGSSWITFDGRTIDTSIPYEVWAWGLNSSGALGNGGYTYMSAPAKVVGGFTDWSQISAGGGQVVGVRSNGTAWGWGGNQCGQLGDGTTIYRSSPVSVVGGFTDWCQVSAGALFSVGLKTNGTAWAWGLNSSGQLGDNTVIDKLSPVSVVGGFTNWCQISTNDLHVLGLRANGTIWAWGCNSQGTLGDNTTTNRSSPVQVSGGFTDWCQISAGNTHNLALRTNGTAWAWGQNYNGQLGDGTTIYRSSPVSVVGGFTDWSQLSANGSYSIGLRTNGTLWAWGGNSSGYLGTGITSYSILSPVSVVGGFTDWCQISNGGTHFLGVKTNGTLWSWGSNGDGELGDGTTTYRTSPVQVCGGFTDWCQAEATNRFSTAMRVGA